MIRFSSSERVSKLQQRLNSDARQSADGSLAGMEMPAQDAHETDGRSGHGRLNFGPYAISPISGLHFESATDTAAS